MASSIRQMGAAYVPSLENEHGANGSIATLRMNQKGDEKPGDLPPVNHQRLRSGTSTRSYTATYIPGIEPACRGITRYALLKMISSPELSECPRVSVGVHILVFGFDF